jgi:type VI secretion system protein ImpH
LREAPWEFNFHQALRLLERTQPDKAPVGSFARPQDEIARLGMDPSFAFPASDLLALDWTTPDAQPRLTVNFLGLVGSAGVLPHPYTRLVRERLRDRDPVLRDFLDLFQHRLLSLFHRAWEKYRVAATYEAPGRDRVTLYLRDLLGLGTESLADRLAPDLPDAALLNYVGLLAMEPRSARALEQVLEDYFGVTARIEQFVGGWCALPVELQCCLNGAESTARQLGMGAVAGDAVWEHQLRARVKLGPLDFARYQEFLPGGAGCAGIQAFTRFYANGQTAFDLQLILQREEVPALELGREDLPLGLATWLESEAGASQWDRDDAVFALPEF